MSKVSFRGVFEIGSDSFEVSGDEVQKMYSEFHFFNHLHFLESWYEHLTGVQFEASDFPWADPFTIDERDLHVSFLKEEITPEAIRYFQGGWEPTMVIARN